MSLMASAPRRAHISDESFACRFVPVVAAVLQLRLFSQLLEAVLLYAETKQIRHAWLMTIATNSSKMLGGIDVLVRELTEVTFICFV